MDILSTLLNLGGTYLANKAGEKAQAPQQQTVNGIAGPMPLPAIPEAPPVAAGSGGGRQINQSVPQAREPGNDQQALIDYLREMGGMQGDREEMMRQQALVSSLRDDGGAMPQMRGRYAPQPMEYAATMAARLASQAQQGDLAQRQRGYTGATGDALTRMYEAMRRNAGAQPPVGPMPADPSFTGMGNVPY